MADQDATGSCLCGAVRYAQQGPFLHMVHCHCSMCRKHHGAPFATWVTSPVDGFRFVAGEQLVESFEASPGRFRFFCRTCGSVLPLRQPERGLVVGPAGNLENDPGIRPRMHIFAGSKASWYEITDDLPRHEAYPANFNSPAVSRPEPAAPSAGCVSGSCLCGAVDFEYEGRPLRMLNCHCSRCRRGRSAAHTTNLFVPLDRFRFRRGGDRVRDFPLPGARYFGVAFCEACGSDVPRLSPERKVAVIPAGSLDTDPGMRPSAHIFTGSKAPWFEITDALPRFEEMPS